MYIDVILPMAIPTPTLTYLCEGDVGIGCRVVVPWGSYGYKEVTGVVLHTDVEVAEEIKDKIRPIIDILDVIPLVPQKTLDFWIWLSQYYMCPLGEVLRTQFSPILSTVHIFRTTLKGRNKRVKYSVEMPEVLPFILDSSTTTTIINEQLPLKIESLVEDLLANDGTILILAPTPEQVKSIGQTLGKWWKVELYYSSTGIQKRGDVFVNVATGTAAKIVVGTSQAMSLPFIKLGAIVVLDAHSSVYKSDRQPQYRASDAALYLAALHSVQCFLVSKTPSVESFYNALHNNWISVKTSKLETPPLRSIVLERGKELISKYLRTKIGQALEIEGQAVVFQNRRGYSSWIECTSCGYTPRCPYCSASLTYHSEKEALQCHYCGHSTPFSPICPTCNSKMDYCGRGTERLQEQLQKLFPEAKVIRVDSDTIKDQPIETIEPDWQIMVGTQIILDERLDFSQVEVVGVANADNIASSADFRSNETTFRTINMLGRRCRESDAELVIQTTKVDDFVINAALKDDFLGFYNNEIEDREKSSYPPFVRLIRIELRSKVESSVFAAASELEESLREVFNDRLSPLYQPIVNKQSGENIVLMLLRIERSSSAAKAKGLLMELTKPVACKYRKDVTINYNVDPI